MEGNYSLSDLASVVDNKDGFLGGGSGILILLFLIIMMGGGYGWGNRQGEFGQYATAASQQEILFGQRFDALGQKVNQIGDGICSSTYALNNSINGAQTVIGGAITSEGRALQMQLADCCCSNKETTAQVRYDMANFASAIQQNDTANTQKILDALAQSKIETLQGRVNQLELQNAVAGVVRYPNGMTYNAGTSPFCNCGYGCCN